MFSFHINTPTKANATSKIRAGQLSTQIIAIPGKQFLNHRHASGNREHVFWLKVYSLTCACTSMRHIFYPINNPAHTCDNYRRTRSLHLTSDIIRTSREWFIPIFNYPRTCERAARLERTSAGLD